MNMALTIAIRYAAIRRQFGREENGNGEEQPIIEYQLHVNYIYISEAYDIILYFDYIIICFLSNID